MMPRRALTALGILLVACGPEPTVREVEVEDAMGLRAGDPVRSAGVDVGRIRGVTLRGERAWISFAVRPDVDLVVDDTCAAVEARGLVGDAMLVLRPSVLRYEPREPGTVPTCPASPVLGDATGPVVEAATSLAELLDAAAHGNGTIARLANDPALAEALAAFLARECPRDVAPAAN